jgi:hypothetical protein
MTTVSVMALRFIVDTINPVPDDGPIGGESDGKESVEFSSHGFGRIIGWIPV